jgi:hypothetical protein
VVDTVKGQFVALIPDDQWEAMVKKHTNDFMSGTGDQSLKGMVNQALQVEIKKKLEAYFAGSDWNSQWDGTYGNVAGKKAREFVLENTPTILADILGGVVQRGIDSFRNSLQQNRGY